MTDALKRRGIACPDDFDLCLWCGSALAQGLRGLSWLVLGEFGYKPHLPGILGTALMVFAILFASSLGWPYAIGPVLGGFAVSHLYVYVFPDVDRGGAARAGACRPVDLSGGPRSGVTRHLRAGCSASSGAPPSL